MSIQHVAFETALRHRIGNEAYAAWFRGAEITVQDRSLHVSACVRFIARWIDAHYKDVALECAREFWDIDEVVVTNRLNGSRQG